MKNKLEQNFNNKNNLFFHMRLNCPKSKIKKNIYQKD